MTAAHTKGPWLAGKPSSVVGWPVVAPAAMGRLICSMNYVQHGTIDPKVSGDDAFNRESEANARLIAAAPDLLEALNPLTSADEATAAHFATLDPDETVTLNIPVRCILRADAAKRKATTPGEAGAVGMEPLQAAECTKEKEMGHE